MLTIGFIGLGLIGGSLAKSLRKVHPEYTLLGYHPRSYRLAPALSEHIIDAVLDEKDPRFSECDYIFLCAPVEHNLEYLAYLKNVIKPACILSDVGSVKGDIHAKIRELGLQANFIGGHPMAGSERTGFENSSDHLFENAYYILTPETETSEAMLSSYTDLVSSIGALPMVLTAQEHDYITAGVSHVPHLVAASLVNLVREHDVNQHMKAIAAGGFKDITRIASSSPVMWEQICMENSTNITKLLDEYIQMLTQIRNAVEKKDSREIFDLFTDSRDYRNSIDDNAKGLLYKSHELYCDLLDETGGIAAISTILATNGINIKNIGIIHNREFEQGVLKVSFYDEEALHRAIMLLKKRNYIIYEC